MLGLLYWVLDGIGGGNLGVDVMTKLEVKQAIEEAERFILRAKALLKSQASITWEDIGSSKESGAVRRASMDLTRSLADLRKPDR